MIFTLLLSVSTSSFAQVLDDEDFQETTTTNTLSQSDDETLFNELFEEYPADERDVTVPVNFNDAISKAAKIVKSYSDSINKDSSSVDTSVEEFHPLDGDMYLSIVGGSFKIFKNIAGRMQCRFSVKLQSEIDKEINIVALSLSYPKRSFAFIFRRVPPKGEIIQSITTSGDICYNLNGAPDIHVNKCRIKNTSSQDCVSHIKWDDRVN